MAPVVDTREDPPHLARLNKRELVYALDYRRSRGWWTCPP